MIKARQLSGPFHYQMNKIDEISSMATDKDKLMKGVNMAAIAFPFYFFGPAVYYWKGAPEMQDGNWWWAAGAVLLMFVAVGFTIRALATILEAFFDR